MGQSDVARLISEINSCEEERNAALQQYAQRLHELKLELAKTCGHRVVRRSWVWGECVDCGFTELIAWPGFANFIAS